MPYDYIEEYQKQDDETIWEFRDKNAQAKIDTSLTETDYANPLSLETMQAQVAKNTKIKLEPIQDLHGYDKPWTGGAGKNLVEPIMSSGSALGITCTNNGDGSFSLSGTATANTTFRIDQSSITASNNLKSYKAGAYTCSGLHGDGVYAQVMQNATWASALRFTDNSTQTLDTDIDNCFILLRVDSGVTVNTTVKLMIEKGNTASPWEPYENICPILGHDQIDILGCGVNIWDEEWENGLYNIDTGAKTSNANYIRNINYIRVKPNESVYIYNGANQYGRYLFYDINKKYISVTNWIKNTSCQVPSNAYYMNFFIDNAYGTTYNNDISINYPSTDTSYHAYQQSNNLSIDLPSTVYGGILDLESGELVVDKEICKVSDLTWSVQTNAQYGKFKSSGLASKIYKTTTEAIAISEYYQSKSDQGAILYNDQIYTNGSGEIKIRDSRYIDDADATAWVAACGNCKIVYRLADSAQYTIYLTPHQLSLLKAQNNLTTSQNTQIKVTYRNGVFATLEELSDATQDIYDEISGDTTTVSGNPLNFTTREKQKSKNTIIDLEPIQDLHGFTKPWVGGAGKNKLKYPYGNTTKTANGVTFTDKGDGTITVSTVSGGATADTEFVIGNASTGTSISLDAGNYILNGCPSDGATNKYYISAFKNGTSIGNDTGSGLSLNSILATDFLGISIWVKSGTVIASAITFKPMVRLSSVTDSTFEPYSNICPISGRTSVDIDGCGKNLLPKLEAGSYTSSGLTYTILEDGTIFFDGNKTSNAVVLLYLYGNESKLPTSDYYLSGSPAGGSDSTYKINWAYHSNDYGNGAVIPHTKGAAGQIRIQIASGYTTPANGLLFKSMLCFASDKSEFTPYQQSTDLTISFGTTVYGGRLDVEKGELVVNRGITTITKDSTVIKNYQGSTTTQFLCYSEFNNAKYYGVASCDKIEYYTGSSGFPPYTFVMTNAGSSTVGMLFILPNEVATTADAAITWLTSNPLQVVYELATPTTIQLTPQQVQLLKGINNISTTGTTITVTFKNGSVAHLDDLPNFTDYDKQKLASIDTLAITLDLLTHTLVVTQDV